MTFIPAITDEAKKVIKEKLEKIAKTQSVHILFAIESGSRAWGFPSSNSDYDVRFVYSRNAKDYLSIRNLRDVIETEIVYDAQLGVPLDITGWDIRKALQLALKSNPVLLEWLQSPICYEMNEKTTHQVLQFAYEVANLDLIKYHYYKLAHNAWSQLEKDKDEVKLKSYFYALRPALSVQWISKFGQIPPMDLLSLMDTLIKDPKLKNAISMLITLKATATEDAKMVRNEIVDFFIQQILSKLPQQKNLPPIISDQDFAQADTLFKKILTGTEYDFKNYPC